MESSSPDIPWDDLAASLQTMAREKLAEQASARWASGIQVVFNRRLRSTAGRALMRQGIIELNPRLVSLGEDELHNTLWHEAAHLLARKRHPIRRIQPHGNEWRKACADLGIPNESATHTLPLPRSKQRPKYAYQCPQCGHQILRVRRIRGQAACSACCKAHNRGRFSQRFVLREYLVDYGQSQPGET